jgi:hypothetical protein
LVVEVGVGVTDVVVVGPLREVDVGLLVALPFVAAALLRSLVGVEQAAIESATATKTVSMQVADQLLNPFDRFTSQPLISVSRVSETVDQLASWMTEASPTLA